MPGVVRSETQGGGMGVHDDEEARKAAKKTAKKAAKKAAREAESTSDADSDADRAARRGAQKKKKRAAGSDSDSDSEPVKVVKKLKGASGEAVPKERGDPKPVRILQDRQVREGPPGERGRGRGGEGGARERKRRRSTGSRHSCARSRMGVLHIFFDGMSR